MAYQTPITIKTALDRIYKHEYVLPAIQREFIWRSEQICKLFDSLMQNFPIGSFLFWKIEEDTSKNFRFFDFVRQYHQKDNPHCPPLAQSPEGTVTAILDGQQRLTALNIGLRGTLAIKERNKWWNNPDAFPVKRLYLNLLNEAIPDEEGAPKNFEFLTEEKAAERSDDKFWFPVSMILEMIESDEPMVYLSEQGLGNTPIAVKQLFHLHKVIHDRTIITFYEEASQDIERVLSIFIRTNSGGTVLSYSDLLLSIATAQWGSRDARSEIHNCVDELNQIRFGYEISKDFVLKAGLMLSDISSVGFKVENFNRPNMKKLEENWPKIAATLNLTIQLVADFGLSRENIRADSALLPIAYYLHSQDVDHKYLNSPSEQTDRARIKNWIIRSLVKPGIWGSGLDVLLTGLREVIKDHSSDGFPVESLEKKMRSRGKTLVFTEEEIEELVDKKYGSRELFGLMTLLFPFIDTRNLFHIDHIYPRALFNARLLKKRGWGADKIARLQALKERLPNLQLLEGALNQSKGQKLPKDWLEEAYPEKNARTDYVMRHMLEGLGSDLDEFEKFFDRRRERLVMHITNVLNEGGMNDDSKATVA